MKALAKNEVIINLTPTGMIPTKKMTPYIPITPEEIIRDVLECAQLGVNVVHLHARDENGHPTYKKEIYRKIILGIRKKRSDLVLGVSCSGRDFNEFEKRSEVLNLEDEAKPDLASLTLSSLNFSRGASVNSPEMIQNLSLAMKEKGIKPELEVFDLGMIHYAKYLIEKKFIEPPYYFNIILGNISSAQTKALHLALMLNDLPQESIVTIGGIGSFQHEANLMGLVFAHGCRIGLEDNIYLDPDRRHLASNVELVRRISKQIDVMGRLVISPATVRKYLNLPSFEAAYNSCGIELNEYP